MGGVGRHAVCIQRLTIAAVAARNADRLVRGLASIPSGYEQIADCRYPTDRGKLLRIGGNMAHGGPAFLIHHSSPFTLHRLLL